jgi:peptide/nickel transport system permease protein
MLMTIPAMFAMSFLVFFIIRLVPGDPALVILGLRATPETLANLRSQLHLDDPLLVQYGNWILNALRGDLGQDFRTGEPITEMIVTRLPVTLEMAILGLLFAAAVGIPLGVIAAVRRGPADVASTGLGLFGISIPEFWLGVMLILIFALELGWLPSSGYVPLRESVRENLRHMALPAITLGVNFAAVLTRTTRAAVVDAMQRPYVQTARAKGLKERSVVVGHVLRNSALPVLTVLGMQFGYALGGAVIIEQVFALPGVGRLTLNAVLERNYPVVQGAVLVVTFLFMLTNIVTDSLFAVIDPRIRTSGR